MNKKGNGIAAWLLAMLITLPAAAWAGFVASKLWGWFVMPIGVASISLWQAAGIALLARLWTYDATLSRDEDKSNAERLLYGTIIAIIVPAFVLGFGAIYHAFQ